MNIGSPIFAQLMEHVPTYDFNKCVERYGGNRKVQSFSCWDQFLAMAFAQLTYRESLRDIEACLHATPAKLYHMGFRSRVAKSTLAYANDTRDWRIYADFAQVLIKTARELYLDDDFGLELEHTVYALDSTTIDLCLKLFPWALFRRRKAAVKMHTLLDLRGKIPTVVIITTGKVHDVNILDDLVFEAGAFYVMDRGYVDFARLYRIHLAGAFFVTRTKRNARFRRICSQAADKASGVLSDQIVVLSIKSTRKDYPVRLRKIAFLDEVRCKRLVFLTNNMTLPPTTIAFLYKSRWHVELFFKWIKQHLRIKAFYGTSGNAVKTQIWIAISIYVLVAIIKKRLSLDTSLYTILQILSVSLFEKMPINQALSHFEHQSEDLDIGNQLDLFR